jgi:hypothetical protein
MERFREGDRVRTRVAKYDLPAGTIGTIRQVFQSVADIYDVQFDSAPQPVIMYDNELEPADNENEASS